MARAIDQYEEGDIIEPEEWRNPEEQSFNHQTLVMTCMRKCIDLGSKELREGWWDEKIDKQGNVRRVWNEDTKKAFMESVRSLLMIITCDFDDEAKTKINKLKQDIADRKKFWLGEEWRWWCSLNNMQQQQLAREGKSAVSGMFNSKLSFDNYFYDDEIQIYREICTELNNLTYRLDFYGQIGYMA
jgi:hypothetical protein